MGGFNIRGGDYSEQLLLEGPIVNGGPAMSGVCSRILVLQTSTSTAKR